MDDKTNKKLIALLFVGVLMGALDISIVGPAIPSIERNLQIDARFSGWIFSIYVLFNLMGISLFARLSDIFGRRIIYIIAIAIFAIGSLWVSLSENFEFLLIGRAIQGFGASGIFPVASAVVGDIFPPEKRGRILGLIGAVFGLAFLMGPFIAGILLHYFSWNLLFIINLPVSAVLIYYSFRILPAVPTVAVSKIDWGGIIFLGITLATFTYAVNSIKSAETSAFLSDPQVIIAFVTSIISLILLLIFEKKAGNPIIKLSFFTNRQIIIAGIIATVTGLVQSCFVFIPKFVVDTFAYAPSKASFMLTPFVLATAIGSPLFGRMIDKYGVKRIIMTGLVLLSAGFFILPFSGGSHPLFYLGGSLIGLGLSVLAGSSLRYIILNNTSSEDRAVSQGMLTIFISVGQLFGTALIGLALGSQLMGEPYAVIFTGVALASMMMFVLSFWLSSSKDGVNHT
jgi:EmrB/QacA subfamily drug resistance transporter